MKKIHQKKVKDISKEIKKKLHKCFFLKLMIKISLVAQKKFNKKMKINNNIRLSQHMKSL